ncbi:protein of unknown function [Methylocella tundrae]|uniref:Uncharacterized protein n=1 Tax=Methylocella tundrae TaxID=227605 RepID=A0A4U8YZ78_METTU|nr:protein of unknown function [Methylocella tundrae]
MVDFGLEAPVRFQPPVPQAPVGDTIGCRPADDGASFERAPQSVLVGKPYGGATDRRSVR